MVYLHEHAGLFYRQMLEMSGKNKVKEYTTSIEMAVDVFKKFINSGNYLCLHAVLH